MTGRKCAVHTGTGSVLTTVNYRPNSPITHGDMIRGRQFNSIHQNKIITTSQVSYGLNYEVRYITA